MWTDIYQLKSLNKIIQIWSQAFVKLYAIIFDNISATKKKSLFIVYFKAYATLIDKDYDPI